MTVSVGSSKNNNWPRNGKIYVEMIDKFMSGWGLATDKVSIFSIECSNETEVANVKREAYRRNEMYGIKRTLVPTQDSHMVHVSRKTYDELGAIWKV